MRTFGILALAMATLASAPAFGQTVMLNFSFQEMREKLAASGASVTKEGDTTDGQHYLSAKHEKSGLSFAVYGSECDSQSGALRCRGADLIASFTMADSSKMREALNFIDYAALGDYEGTDGNLKLSRYVIFDNGITPANLTANIDVFLALAQQAWDKLDDAKYLK